MLSVSIRGLRCIRALLLCSSVALLPAHALAQVAPAPAPSQAIPTREQVEPPRPDPQTPPAQVRIDSSQAIGAPACPLDQYDVRVRIDRIVFTGLGGATLAPEIRTLLADIAPASAEEQPIAAVCAVRDRANERLRRAGYVASVQIPPQTIETGELRLEVITARIVEMRIRGDAPPYRERLAARAEQLKALDPLNERDAERILLLTSDIPGLDVQLTLRPAGTVPGEVIGELNVMFRRYSLVANAQNYGSRQLGRETAYVRGELFGLTGFSDVTYFGLSSTFDTDEQQVVQIGHLAGLGDRGLTAEASFIHAWSRPDLGPLDLRSKTLIGRLALAAPLRVRRRETIALSGGLEIIEQRTRVFQNDVGTPLNRDKMRVAFIRVEANVREPRLGGGDAYSLNGSLEVRRGLDIFDATKRGLLENGFSPTRIQGDPTATVVRAEATGVVGIGPVFSLAGGGFGQWANNPLLNFEEFSLGNLTYGRGYDPGANSADRAIALRGEVRAKFYDTPRVRAELFGFYDSVWIWNEDANSVEDERRLGSFGGGVRVLLRGRAFLEAMYARPEDRALLVPGAVRASDRFLVSLTVQFGPGGR